MDYRQAGVDIAAGRAFVAQIGQLVASTRRPEVLGDLGGFGGCFRLPSGYADPVLVAGTDGVGTKLAIAHACNCHDTVGVDLVAMCVNDVLAMGAEPLFFLDYLATGKLLPAQLASVVAGIAAGCRESGCALLGGETAEMPGFYGAGQYDLAGFCVGIAERSQLLDGSRVAIGDVAIALASSGLHSNGFSLARKIAADGGWVWDDRLPELGDRALGEVFLTPTRLYVQSILALQASGVDVRGLAHITGGGLPENLPRCLGAEQALQIDVHSWDVPPVFQWLAAAGGVAPADMFSTFNMGVGFAALVSPEDVELALGLLRDCGQTAWPLGTVVAGKGNVLGLPNA
ncbi:phosphoribosylaminoimidazole synthetase [Rubidibacter lacunae KORDI 51-2]|uniref:Phosphoribosylformylglycinamidine cyclo-ligase n=1 Tax=Rubidibacter lacunae KORDI 51-2 TaxID=582515 RepID=U5DFS4_9CHRO|nr:phosphoribosylformylglycinamidine cyclo-ligase [Rubidibacter lacunae]ERN40451.1 phosphoribosylaminoimidazole synthetase [Rubidibacter lacunae KORDI 51-2]